MARSNTGSTSNRAAVATVPITAAPGTMAMWFKPANLTSFQQLLYVINTANTSYFGIGYDGANTFGLGDNVAYCEASLASVNQVGVSPTGGTANVWMHIAGVFNSGTSRTAYLNGAAGSVSTNSAVPTTMNRTDIGHFAATNPLNGSMAEIAIWTAALTAAEILSLAKGASPLSVRPEQLVRYWPVFGNGAEADVTRNQIWTITGTLAKDKDNPQVSRPPHGPEIGRTVTIADQNITGVLFQNTQTFGTNVSLATYDITGVKFTNTQSFGTNVISATYAITGVKFQNTQTFGAATISAAYDIVGVKYQNNQTFSTAVVTTTYDIAAVLYQNLQSFGTNVVSQDTIDQDITGVLYQNLQTYGVAEITASYSVAGTKFTNTQTFGTNVVTATYNINAAKYTNIQTFGSASVAWDQVILAALYTNPQTFGSHIIALDGVAGTGGGSGLVIWNRRRRRG